MKNIIIALLIGRIRRTRFYRITRFKRILRQWVSHYMEVFNYNSLINYYCIRKTIQNKDGWVNIVTSLKTILFINSVKVWTDFWPKKSQL